MNKNHLISHVITLGTINKENKQKLESFDVLKIFLNKCLDSQHFPNVMDKTSFLPCLSPPF